MKNIMNGKLAAGLIAASSRWSVRKGEYRWQENDWFSASKENFRKTRE